jgi:hypothetical protein
MMDPKKKDNGFVGQFISHHKDTIGINLFRGFTKAVAEIILDKALGKFSEKVAGEINVFGTKENYGEALKCTLSLGLESFIEWGLSKFIDGGEEEPKEVKTRE